MQVWAVPHESLVVSETQPVSTSKAEILVIYRVFTERFEEDEFLIL